MHIFPLAQSQDLLVAVVAICLGLGAFAGSISGGRLVRWSGVAQGLESLGGRKAVVIVYALLGLALLSIGISLLRL